MITVLKKGISSAPIIKFEKKGRTGAIPDADTMGGFCWLINERVKAIFDQVDPEGFIYCKVELDLSDFPEPCSSYWFAYFVRELNCVDEMKSQICANYDEPDKYGEILAIKMVPELVENAHALRLSSAPEDTWLIDDVLVQALEKENIQGFAYRPIRRADLDIEKAVKVIVSIYENQPERGKS